MKKKLRKKEEENQNRKNEINRKGNERAELAEKYWKNENKNEIKVTLCGEGFSCIRKNQILTLLTICATIENFKKYVNREIG